MLVLRDVIFGNRRHFRELLEGSEARIASNILSTATPMNVRRRALHAGTATLIPQPRQPA